MELSSLYLHIPFCRHRCGYCDFNTYANLSALIPDYVDALCKEISWNKDRNSRDFQIQTIFFGGGTPSLLKSDQFGKILECINKSFVVNPNAEITLEANPGTVTQESLKDLYSINFNRISFGMQTSHPFELRLLERQHDFFDVINAVKSARKAGFGNINLDLIFGLPGQTMASWQKSLTAALSLNPEHLSLYALSFEHGTPFDRWNRRGLLESVDDDQAADMYTLAGSLLQQNGYVHYEISNWAKHYPDSTLANTENPVFACQHNLQYWRNLPYFGFGAGAHGFIKKIRTANVLSPKAYIQRLENPSKLKTNQDVYDFPRTPATIVARHINQKNEIGETMMMGLRLTREGVNSKNFLARFQKALPDLFEDQILRLEKDKLIEWIEPEKSHLRLTEKGHLLGNQVFLEFI